MRKRRHILGKKKETNHRAKVLLGVFIAFIMVSSIFGIVVSFNGGSVSNTFTEEDIKFTLQQQGQSSFLEAKIDGTTYEFIHLPSQTSRISADAESKQLLLAPTLQLTFKPPANITGAIDVVRLSIADDEAGQGRQVVLGIVEPHSLYTALPNITCASSTQDAPVVILQFGEQNQITAQDTCVTATAVSIADMLLLGDFIRYIRLGVLS